MSAPREFRVFVSAVSGELESYRAEVVRVLQRKEIEVRDQDHFRLGGATLLEQLAAYIGKCDAVILLVGERAGAFPSDDHVAALGVVPIFEQYRRETSQARASYTQWELLLGKHHGKRTYIFFTGAGFSPEQPNGRAADAPGAGDLREGARLRASGYVHRPRQLGGPSEALRGRVCRRQAACA